MDGDGTHDLMYLLDCAFLEKTNILPDQGLKQ